MYKLENDVEWTNDLKNAFKHGITKAKIIYTDDNNETREINQDNNLVSIEIKDHRFVPNVGFIGQATSRMATIKLLNTDELLNLENKELEIKIGAIYNGDDYYIDYGTFIVDPTPENDVTNDQSKIIAYDYMLKANKMWEDNVTYPCTLRELATAVCTQIGIDLQTESFTNEDFIVENNQFPNDTCRSVIQNIAKCAFSWARIGQDNKLYFDFVINDNVNETITPEEYKADCFKVANEYYGPINKVTYAQNNIQGQEEFVEDSESIEEYGTNELLIYDNLFAYTSEKRYKLIQEGIRLFGLKYMPITQLDMVGLAYLDCNDVIEVTTVDGLSFISRVFNHTINYKGFLADSVETEGISQNQLEYENKNSLLNISSRTEIIVNKHEKEIESLVIDMYDNNGKIEENFTTIRQEINGVVTNVQNTGGSNLILNSVMYAYDNNGNPNEWEVSGNGTLQIQTSTESLNNGCLSGNVFILDDKTVSQTIRVAKAEEGREDNTCYTFSCRVKKNTVGTAYIKLYNENEEHIINYENGTSVFYEEAIIQEIYPKDNYLIIELYGSADSGATFTDLMLNIGQYKTQWQQASGEIMNTQVNIDTSGILVKSTVYDGNYTVMSPIEFAGYSNKHGTTTKVFSLNDDVTEVEKIEAQSEISMPPIKIVPVKTGTMPGWAFVSTES